jgi:hypothetical protein
MLSSPRCASRSSFPSPTYRRMLDPSTGRSGVVLPRLRHVPAFAGPLQYMSNFLVVAWALQPELISSEVGCAIPEPVEPFVERAPPVFLRSSEIIYSKCVTLQFRVLIQILDIHVFHIPSDSNGDSSSRGDSSSEYYPDYDPDHGFQQPWLYRLTSFQPGWGSLVIIALTGDDTSWSTVSLGGAVFHRLGHVRPTGPSGALACRGGARVLSPTGAPLAFREQFESREQSSMG